MNFQLRFVAFSGGSVPKTSGYATKISGSAGQMCRIRTPGILYGMNEGEGVKNWSDYVRNIKQNDYGFNGSHLHQLLN